MKIESKTIGGNIVEHKQEDRNGVPVGIVAGYIATWDLDRVDDRFVRGAFMESIEEHKAKGRQIRLKDHHGRTVGGFPSEFIREDEKGLYGVGEINLEVQQGKEAFLLAKQGVLSDFSIGFSVVDYKIEDDVRVIHKATVWEGSIVDEPANPAAKITEVKNNFFDADAVKGWGKREVEENLIKTGAFSKKAAKIIASQLDKKETIDQTQVLKVGISDELAKSILDEISILKSKLA